MKVRSPLSPAATSIVGEIARYDLEHPDGGWSFDELARLIEARLRAEGMLT